MTDVKELARRAVRCKAWRWLPGMRYVAPSGYLYRVDDVAHAAGGGISDECLPYLGDPVTIGCLLHLVREAWGVSDAHTVQYWRPDNTCAWICVSPNSILPRRQTHGQTQAEALVKALENEVNND